MTRCACLAQRVPRCQQFRETLLSARSSSLLEVLPACHDDLRHDELLGRAWCVRLPADPVSGGYVLDKCAPPLLVCLYLCLSWLVLPRSPSVPRSPRSPRGIRLTVCAAGLARNRPADGLVAYLHIRVYVLATHYFTLYIFSSHRIQYSTHLTENRLARHVGRALLLRASQLRRGHRRLRACR